MKRIFFIVPALSVTLLFGCDPDRRTADEDSYEETEEGVDIGEERVGVDSRADIITDNASVEGMEEETVELMREVARISLVEAELAQLALEKAEFQEVRDYSQMILNEHQKINEELAALARGKEFTMPESVEEKLRDKLEELRGLNGADFDQEYINMLVDMQEESIDKLDGKEDDILDIPTQRWIKSTLPIMRSHYEQGLQVKEWLNESL